MASPGNCRPEVLLFALLVGCGARAPVEGSTHEGRGSESGSGGTRSGAGGSNDPGASGGSTSIPDDPAPPIDIGDVALPECQLGPPSSSAGSSGCSYVASGNCYDDPEMACACACRGLADNRCIIGGFLNPDEPQTVRCTAR
ncbi:MAG TPA: hypothetical protein VMG12_09505 [Polyangiaceae bacterium]|nr:hypothetical protein [Polyangiaceae bacterium]